MATTDAIRELRADVRGEVCGLTAELNTVQRAVHACATAIRAGDSIEALERIHAAMHHLGAATHHRKQLAIMSEPPVPVALTEDGEAAIVALDAARFGVCSVAGR